MTSSAADFNELVQVRVCSLWVTHHDNTKATLMKPQCYVSPWQPSAAFWNLDTHHNWIFSRGKKHIWHLKFNLIEFCWSKIGKYTKLLQYTVAVLKKNLAQREINYTVVTKEIIKRNLKFHSCVVLLWFLCFQTVEPSSILYPVSHKCFPASSLQPSWHWTVQRTAV